MDKPLFAHALCLDASVELVLEAINQSGCGIALDTIQEYARARTGGFVACLNAESIRLAWLDYGQPVHLRYLHKPGYYSLVIVPKGRSVIRQASPERISHARVHFVAPATELDMFYGDGAAHLVVCIKESPEWKTLLDTIFIDGKGTGLPGLQDNILHLCTHFIADQSHSTRWEKAEQLTCEFGLQILNLLQSSLLNGSAPPPPKAPSPRDNRIDQIARYIRTNPQWDYDPDTLREMTGMSLRGLYYAFERTLGSTPYRYYRTCKLLRVRAALIKDYRQRHPIAWHATNEGFFHLSRFAAQYRELFGELPSDTVQRQRTLAKGLDSQEKYQEELAENY